MPSVFTHSFAALALGKVYAGHRMPVRFWVLTALCAALPDADFVSFYFGFPYGSVLGHRGITHSLFFAAALAPLVVALFFRKNRAFSKAWWALTVYFFVVTASHPLLDMLTNGGRGVALFAPFDSTRYFFPWRPVEVSPIGLSFFSERGLDVIESEFLWIWLPAILLAAAARAYRRLRRGAQVR